MPESTAKPCGFGAYAATAKPPFQQKPKPPGIKNAGSPTFPGTSGRLKRLSDGLKDCKGQGFST
ncbi:hypothetical protein [Neisseria musculi]|uniref:hypothetical protein n=1 Tax=Neisseria musculi TaxID=1815583 RepID=UPI00164AEF5B|nr:hypothetical protein [Neisseria musculi]